MFETMKYILFLICLLSNIACFGQDENPEVAISKLNVLLSQNRYEEAQSYYMTIKPNLDSTTDDMLSSMINIGLYTQNRSINVETTVASIKRVINVFSENKEDLKKMDPGMMMYFQIYISFLVKIDNPFYIDVYRLYKDIWPEINKEYSTAQIYILESVVNNLIKEAQYKDSTPILEELIKLYQQGYQLSTKPYTYYKVLGICYQESGKVDKAATSYENALRLYKELNGNVSQDTVYASTESTYANLRSLLGDYETAVRLFTEASNIYKVYGTSNPRYATLLRNLAHNYSNLGNYEKAIEIGTQTLDIYKTTIGEEHPDYGITLITLAYCYSSLGDYTKAIELGTNAMEIFKRTSGEEHPNYAASLNEIANCYKQLGDYAKAIEFGTQAMEIFERTIGEDHPYSGHYVQSLIHLADCYSNTGDYTKALEFCTKALDISKRITLGEEHPDFAQSLNRLADFYSNIGDYAKALELSIQAMDILKTTLGEEHPDYARSLGNLADYYSELGDYAKAIELGTQAMEILKRTLGEEHPDFAGSLGNLAKYYSELGDYVKSIEYDTRALEIYKRTLGGEHPYYAASLGNLAYYYSKVGDYSKAIEFGTQAIEIFKRTLGEEHPDYAILLGGLAYYYSEREDYDSTLLLLKKIIPIEHNTVLSNFSGLTANERYFYWGKYANTYTSWIPKILVHSGLPNVASVLYDHSALFAKGLLLSTELEMTKLIQERGDNEALQMYYELHQNRQILNAQYSKPIAERSINCDSLERISNNLERQLVSRVKEFGDYSRNLSITWQDVQSKLNDDDIAIEFLSYTDKDGGMHYAALTLCKNDTAPILTPLFVESKLLETQREDKTYQTLAADSLIWGSLSSLLNSKSHVYFSASGMLHNIGIEYLPSMEGKECYRLSSTRELVTHKPSEGIKSATLFGDIDYDASYASIKSSETNIPSVPVVPSAPSSILYAENTDLVPIIGKSGRGGFDVSSLRSLRYSVDSLPGSRKEIQAISALLKKSGFKVQDCNTKTRNQASEESFKSLSGQRKSLIHIATHGFYYEETEAENKGEHLRMMLMGDDIPSHSEDKSLLRCGLCFAGANQFLREESLPADGQDEGILNALEIAQTDLRGLDLVVLSACQTALGDIAQGEGVFGLQRGFKKAGAQSILMSLWNVDDEVTQLLMTEFYRGWTSGMTKTAALRNAQTIVKEKYPDPRHWAAFILLDALD